MTDSREFCKWVEDQADAAWETDCGQYWQFYDGGPQENKVRFCHWCGQPVQAHRAALEGKGDE